jgi:protein-disulfide isomerase
MNSRSILLAMGAFLVTPSCFQIYAKDRSMAYKIGEKTVSFEQVYEENQGDFYKLEKQKFDLLEMIAKEKYLESFWSELAEKSHTTANQARADYLQKYSSVEESEIQSFIDRYKGHSKLKDLTDKEKKKQAIDYLTARKTESALDKIITDAIRSKKLVVLYPKPEEPVYTLKISEKDHIKYGPNPADTLPLGCSSDCPITIVEYSEYQCPFCARVLPTIKQVMNEYKGKVRWIVRDFPLGFHSRAKPAAIAAKCASDQKKFWEMYEALFTNQRNLSDDDLKSYGKLVGLNQSKYEECLSNPQHHLDSIEENYRSGERLGISGTPAFLINGRKIDGAIPFEVFKMIIEEELTKTKRQ